MNRLPHISGHSLPGHSLPGHSLSGRSLPGRLRQGGILATVLVLSLACGDPASRIPPVETPDELREAVLATERSFAATMADRDLEAFSSFIDEEAVFLTGDGVLHGRTEILTGWAGYFETTEAPFSWSPSRAVVLDSGDLAMSTGPVLNAEGACVGTFTSVWRRAPNASWKIIFDRGSSSCYES